MVINYKELSRLFKNSYLGDKKTQIESQKTLKEYWKSEYGNDVIGISKFFNTIRNKIYNSKSDNVVLKNILPVIGVIDGKKRVIAVPKEEVRDNYGQVYDNENELLVSTSLDGILFVSKECCAGSGQALDNTQFKDYQIRITENNLDEILFEGYRVLDLESSLDDDAQIADGHFFEHSDSNLDLTPYFI